MCARLCLLCLCLFFSAFLASFVSRLPRKLSLFPFYVPRCLCFFCFAFLVCLSHAFHVTSSLVSVVPCVIVEFFHSFHVFLRVIVCVALFGVGGHVESVPCVCALHQVCRCGNSVCVCASWVFSACFLSYCCSFVL